MHRWRWVGPGLAEHSTSPAVPRHPTPYRHAPPTAGDAPGFAVSPCDLLQNLPCPRSGLQPPLLKRVFSCSRTFNPLGLIHL